MENIFVRGPPGGYSPDPTKTIMLISEINLQQAQNFFQGMDLKVVTRSAVSDSNLQSIFLFYFIWGGTENFLPYLSSFWVYEHGVIYTV